MVVMMLWFGDAGLEWWQAGLMWVAMIVFWATVIWVAYALLTGGLRRDGGPRREDPPGHIPHGGICWSPWTRSSTHSPSRSR